MSCLLQSNSMGLRRAGYFTASLLLVNLVGDGWTGRPSPLVHQLLLLPITGAFLWSVFQLLRSPQPETNTVWTPHRALLLALGFELLFLPLYLYECRHFAAFGYRRQMVLVAAILVPCTLLLALAAFRRIQPGIAFAAVLLSYAGGMLASIESFPLNYLRSDMLPVILWADGNLLHHLDPYATLHIANRLYDFPYLPGMMLASYPFAALGVDIRLGSIFYVVASAAMIYFAANRSKTQDNRLAVAALLALFLLCPFLQYRHELYLQPHWFTLVLMFVLMQRRHFAWAALAFGVSMAIYQFSWILFPFFVLNAFRRRGWLEALKLVALGTASALVVVGPFLRSASHRIASNTVGQWGHVIAHAMADPINLSFWVTYVVRTDQLLQLQAVVMVMIFLYCFTTGRCNDLADTLRWMIVALTIFVLLNVLVDGYFFLMLLVPMLVYTCVANGWWAEPELSAKP